MRTRSLVVAAVAAALVLPGAAAVARAPKTACNLVTDQEGDGNMARLQPYAARAGLNSDALDVVGGDVASGAKTVVVQIRLKSTTPGRDPQTLDRTYWMTSWVLGDTTYKVYGHQVRDGEMSSLVFVGNDAVKAALLGVVKDETSITWTLDRTKLPHLATRGQKFSRFRAYTYVDTITQSNAADDSSASRVYVDRQAHCRLRPA